MIIRELYKYQRADDGIDVSPAMPDVAYDLMYRVIADSGKLVTQDGEHCCLCIDTASADGWYEIDMPNEEPRTSI